MTVDRTGLPLGGRGLSQAGLRTLALPLVVGLAFQPWSALAQSFTVVNGQTTGQQAMFNAGDIGVIELGGTVSPAAGQAGVIMGAVDQMLDNAGSIATTDAFGYGVYSQLAGATIDNSGSIATTGAFGYGIYSTGADAAITNSGNIATAGAIAYGIYSGGADAAITNTGNIMTTGPISDGIYSTGADATITNTGSIAATGPVAAGINAAGTDATVVNSGSIIAYDAIRFSQGNAILKLLSGTAIQGGLVFAGTGNTVSFGPGLNAVMTFYGSGIPGTVETSGNPFAVDGNTIAVLDRTGLALKEDMALSLAGDIAGAVGRGASACLVAGGTKAGEAEDCSTTAWLAGFGGFGGRDGNESSVASAYGHGGALAGVEFSPGDGFTGGLFIGGAAARGNAGTADKTALSGGVAGGHAGFARDGYFVDFYAAMGVLDTDSERTVANNSIDFGVSTASGTESGSFFNPAVTIGADLDTANGILTPSLRLRYTALKLDGYAETGSSDGLVVDARTVHELEIRAQAALALTPVTTEAGEASWTLRAGADAIDRRGDVSAELLGQDITFASAAAGTTYRGFAGVDLDYALAGGDSLFGDLELRLDDQLGQSAVASVGLSGAF